MCGISVSVMVFLHTFFHGYTSKDHLNFMVVTILQHCQYNSIAKQ